MTLALIVALTLAARPLSPDELAAVQPLLGERKAIAGQAFETSELAPDTRYWFVPAEKNGDFVGLLLDSEKKTIGRFELDAAAREQLVSFDAVAFTDANEDGLADVIAVVSVRSEAGPAKRKALLLLQTTSGYKQDLEQERAVTDALGEKLTVARIRERLRPPLLSRVTVSCRSLKMPMALSGEGLLAYSPGDSTPLWNLVSGEAPSWMTPRLREAIERIEGAACWWERDADMPHGGRPTCSAPIEQLNGVLAGVKRAPSFSFAAGNLDSGAVSLRGSKLYLQSSLAGLKPGRIPVPADCPLEGEEVVGTIASARDLAIFLVLKDTEVPTSLYKDPEEAEECLQSGGTCVQDIVQEPVDLPRVLLVTVRPSR